MADIPVTKGGKVLIEGLLWKKARGRSFTAVFHKPWALRWFKLERGILQYYKSAGLSGENEKEGVGDDVHVLKGTLLVESAQAVIEVDPHKPFVFLVKNCVNTENGHHETLILAASNEHDMYEWLFALGNKDIKLNMKATPFQLRRAVSRKAAKIEELYVVNDRLGSGGFSIVKAGVDRKDNTTWALKLIPTYIFHEHRERTEEEVKVLASLNHPNIVKLREIVRTENYFVVVMEILRGGDLFERIVQRKRYSEQDAKIIAHKILIAAQYLHDNDIVHRDIKPENILFESNKDDSEIKLTDFGFATMYDRRQKLTTTCGTPEYVAPEILKRKAYGLAVDLWSIGVVIYILLCGFPPFYGSNETILFDKICRGKYQFVSPHWDAISREAKNLIDHLLEINPDKRYTARQALNHEWFANVHFEQPESIDSADLSNALDQMKVYNAFRKFRKGVLFIIAANRLRDGVQEANETVV